MDLGDNNSSSSSLKTAEGKKENDYLCSEYMLGIQSI
jgi:hypothetical protein